MFWNSVAWAMPGAAQGAEGGGSMVTSLVPIVLMFAIFYFLMIRPQMKKQKEHKAMLANLNKGETILTTGGLQGRITGVTDAYVTIEIAEKVRVKIARGYVAAKITANQAPPEQTAQKK